MPFFILLNHVCYLYWVKKVRTEKNLWKNNVKSLVTSLRGVKQTFWIIWGYSIFYFIVEQWKSKFYDSLRSASFSIFSPSFVKEEEIDLSDTTFYSPFRDTAEFPRPWPSSDPWVSIFILFVVFFYVNLPLTSKQAWPNFPLSLSLSLSLSVSCVAIVCPCRAETLYSSASRTSTVYSWRESVVVGATSSSVADDLRDAIWKQRQGASAFYAPGRAFSDPLFWRASTSIGKGEGHGEWGRHAQHLVSCPDVLLVSGTRLGLVWFSTRLPEFRKYEWTVKQDNLKFRTRSTLLAAGENPSDRQAAYVIFLQDVRGHERKIFSLI